MTYKEIDKYLSMEAPTDAERKAYHAISALMTFKGFADMWRATTVEGQDDIFSDVTEALEEPWN